MALRARETKCVGGDPGAAAGRERGKPSPSEFGLAPPRYSVSVRATGAPLFEIEFGALSPQGLAQYARVTGHAEIVLLPSFIGEQWESVIGAP